MNHHTVGDGFTLAIEDGLLRYVKHPLTRAAYASIYSFVRSSVLRILP